MARYQLLDAYIRRKNFEATLIAANLARLFVPAMGGQSQGGQPVDSVPPDVFDRIANSRTV